MPRTSIVMITRNRRQRVLATLPRLLTLNDVEQVIVVDDASQDGTAAAVGEHHPDVVTVRLDSCRGAAARTIGVTLARTPYVAFADDDSWWAAGALDRAADLLDGHPTVGLLAARILVGSNQIDDPVNSLMADSPLGADGLPGPEVLGFVACGAVVRRTAFLQAGGFHPRMQLGGEEELLALDLRRAGWRSAYAADVVALHHPADGVRPGRRRRLARNQLWTAWLRRPLPSALSITARTAWSAITDPAAATGVIQALGGLRWIARERCALSPDVELDRRKLATA